MKNLLFVWKSLLFLLIIASLTFLVIDTLGQPYKKTEPIALSTDEAFVSRENIRLVAIGDSLTEGVGDSSNRGGYVPLVAEKLRHSSEFLHVTTQNYGKKGDTTLDIQKRIEKTKEIQNSLQNASVVTLSAGGNDLIDVIKKSGLHMDEETVVAQLTDYEENLHQLLDTIRQSTPETPLFLFGIYNPYESELGDIPFLHALVEGWNEVAKKSAQESDNTYFVALEDLLQGSSSEQDTNKEGESKEDASTYLFEEDFFHPNEQGYQRIADELAKEMFDVLSKKQGG